MKKLFFNRSLVCALVAFITMCSQGAFAQSEKFALGLQYQSLTYGLSAKYNINTNSTIQATINPISANDFNLNFYGARYYYSFSKEGEQITPYLFAGAGIMTYKYEFAKLTGGVINDYSGSFFGYNAGAGVKGRIAKKIELSADLGYGKLNFSDGLGIAGVNLGFGIHYCIN